MFALCVSWKIYCNAIVLANYGSRSGLVASMQGKPAKIDAQRALSCNGEVTIYNGAHFYAHFPTNTSCSCTLKKKTSLSGNKNTFFQVQISHYPPKCPDFFACSENLNTQTRKLISLNNSKSTKPKPAPQIQIQMQIQIPAQTLGSRHQRYRISWMPLLVSVDSYMCT